MLDARTDTRRSAGRGRAVEVAGAAALGGAVASAAVLAAGAAGARQRYFVPSSRNAFPDWLAGPLHPLGVALEPRTGALLLLALLGCWLAVVATARTLPARLVWGAVIAAHVALLLAPPLFSADLFGYVGYARLFAVHGIDPYLHGASAAPLDPVRPFVGWHGIATPYGPLFTVASTPLAAVSVPVALWACKLLAAAGSLLCVWLVARLARARGADVATAVAFFGLNPLLLAYEVGGGHNDTLPVALVLVALLLAAERRPAGAGASAALAAGVKASSALALPFVLLAAPRRWRALVGAAAGIALTAAVGLAAFGTSTLAVGRQLRQQQQFVAHNSVPRRVAELLGFDHLPDGLRLAAGALFAVAVALLLLAVWRRRLDALAGLGWATLALLLASAWMVPWYAVWLLPLAAVARSPALAAATVLLCAWLLAMQVHWLL